MPDQILRYVEAVEEPTFSPATLPTQNHANSVWCDPATVALDTPSESDAIVESAFGRAPNQKYGAFYNPAGEISYAINVHSVAAFLKWVCGGYAFTAGGVGPPQTPNIHEVWGSDLRVLPSFVARCGKDQFEHVFQGCTIDTLEFEVEDATTTATADTSAAVDSKASTQSPAAILANLPQEPVIPFHSVDVTIGGVMQARKIKNLTLSIGNNLDVEQGRYLGSRFPGRIPANERETTLEMELDFSDTAQIERVWGAPTGPTKEGSAVFPMSLTFHGGDNADGEPMSLYVLMPRVFYTTIETQPEGREEAVQTVECRAMTDTVTLDDGTTEIVTDIYAKIENMLPVIAPYTVS